jgi:hypothetical protein
MYIYAGDDTLFWELAEVALMSASKILDALAVSFLVSSSTRIQVNSMLGNVEVTKHPFIFQSSLLNLNIR